MDCFDPMLQHKLKGKTLVRIVKPGKCLPGQKTPPGTFQKGDRVVVVNMERRWSNPQSEHRMLLVTRGGVFQTHWTSTAWDSLWKEI